MGEGALLTLHPNAACSLTGAPQQSFQETQERDLGTEAVDGGILPLRVCPFNQQHQDGSGAAQTPRDSEHTSTRTTASQASS